MSTSPITFANTQPTIASQVTSAASSATGLANEQTFLQLLVAQIKNQDPTQPTDGTQFLTQLAQFSQLEQLLGIKGDLDNMNAATMAAQQQQQQTSTQAAG